MPDFVAEQVDLNGTESTGLTIRAPGETFRVELAVPGFYNAYNGDLSQGWSDGMYHSRHNTIGDGASQNMGQMYRTRAEAAMALRIEMSRNFAKKLAELDRIIREES